MVRKKHNPDGLCFFVAVVCTCKIGCWGLNSGEGGVRRKIAAKFGPQLRRAGAHRSTAEKLILNSGVTVVRRRIEDNQLARTY